MLIKILKPCLLPLVAWLVTGCATIIKSGDSRSTVAIESPDELRVYDARTATAILVTRYGPGDQSVRLPADTSRLLLIRDRVRGVLVSLEPRVGIGWIAADLVTSGGLGMIPDAATGCWREFADIRRPFDTPMDTSLMSAAAFAALMARTDTIPWLTLRTARKQGLIFDRSILELYLGFGITSLGANQAVLAPPHGRAGLMAGITESLRLGLSAEYNVHTGMPTVQYEYATLTRYSAEARYLPFTGGGWFVSGGCGAMNVHFDGYAGAGTAYSGWLPEVHGGLGFAGEWFYAESQYTIAAGLVERPGISTTFRPGYLGIVAGITLHL